MPYCSARWSLRRLVMALDEEIAEMLGVTYTNVNRQLTRGRAEVRKIRDPA